MSSQIQALVQPLLDWFSTCQRILPWRENKDPYRVWVSEIMLQQTRVEAVIPYYNRFLQRLPSIKALADCPEEELLKLWEGLGYYNRVRNLQKAAKVMVKQYGGQFPHSWEQVRALPGIGDYTAGAICSIAFDQPTPAVDGNVLRVLSRVLCRYDNILDPRVKRRTERELRQVLPQRVGDFNQSLMELGALVCLPGGPPKCLVCPLRQVCRGRAQGVAEELPVKAKAKPRRREDRTVFLLVSREGRLALSRRPDQGLLAGLWELPAAEGALSREEACAFLESQGFVEPALTPGPKAKHVFSHVEWHMTSFAVQGVEELPSCTWVTGRELREAYALPSAFKAYVPQLQKLLGP